jgi:hypothetical protein
VQPDNDGNMEPNSTCLQTVHVKLEQLPNTDKLSLSHMFLFWPLLLLCFLGTARVYVVLSKPTAPRKRSQSQTCSLAVFLGSGAPHRGWADVCLTPNGYSGGHTSEALLLLETLDFKRYTPRVYLISEGDTLSAQKAIAFEASRQVCASSPRMHRRRDLTNPCGSGADVG